MQESTAVALAEAGPAPLTLTLFGPGEVLVGGAPLPPMRSRKSLWLLCLLALRYPRPTQRDWLTGMLWPDADQAQAFANLRTVLSELRRALGSEGARLQSPDRHTLVLDLRDAAVDTLAFESAVASEKPSAWEHAVELYRGPLLEGCREEWVFQERTAREQHCLEALRKLAEAAAATGDYEAAAGWYRRAIVIDPWWDTARRRLMEILVKGGDLNEALQVYRSFEDLLKSESGAVPDEQTTALYLRLRAEARRRAQTSPAIKPAATPSVGGYLPHPVTALVGREDERADVATLLRRSRLVTLTGLGGIGKTRLAISVAGDIVSDYPDGVWLVALESLTDSKLIPQQIGTVLGLGEVGAQPWLQRVTDHCRAKRLVLVLDNCEHLIDESARIAAHLLQECAGVRILATSREALGIIGETAWAVPSLPFAEPEHLPRSSSTLQRVLMGYESVQLFLERARAAHSDFSLNPGNAVIVARICGQLEGIPLAIELAAARLRSMTVEEVAERLRDHLSLLTAGSRTAQTRQRTLASTLDWSYRLLSDSEKALLRRLSVFIGGWTLRAAEEICGGNGMPAREVADLMSSLVEKSLVLFENQSGDGQGRYRLVEMVRQYAEEKAREEDDPAWVRGKHRDWFVGIAEESEGKLKGDEQHLWLRRLGADVANLRAALDGCAADDTGTDAGLRMAGALARFWYMRGDFSEGRRHLQRALDRDASGGPSMARATALHGIGTLAYRQSDYALAKGLHEQSLAIRESLGDKEGAASSLLNLGNVAYAQGDFAPAVALYEKALDLSLEVGDKHSAALILGNLGSVRLSQGENPAARPLFEKSLLLFRELKNDFHIAWALNNLGILAAERGDFAAAREYFDECLPLFRKLGERRGVAWSLNKLGGMAHDDCDYETARSFYEESQKTFSELGDRHGVACCLHELGTISLDQDNRAQARPMVEESLRIFRDIGDRQGIIFAEQTLAVLALAEGDVASARTSTLRCLATSVESGQVRSIVRGLEEIAQQTLCLAAPAQAVRLLGAASRMREELSLVTSTNERLKIEPCLREARLALGEDTYLSCWEEGRRLTSQEAVAYAGEEA